MIRREWFEPGRLGWVLGHLGLAGLTFGSVAAVKSGVAGRLGIDVPAAVLAVLAVGVWCLAIEHAVAQVLLPRVLSRARRPRTQWGADLAGGMPHDQSRAEVLGITLAPLCIMLTEGGGLVFVLGPVALVVWWSSSGVLAELAARRARAQS